MENQTDDSTEQQTNTINLEVPTIDNLARRRPIIPTAFALAVVCFFFTFSEIKCSGEKLLSISGLNLVTGKTIKVSSFMGSNQSENIPPSIYAIIAFVAGLFGLIIFLIRYKREAFAKMIAGIIGTISLIILQFSLRHGLDKEASGDVPIEITFEFAYWLSLFSMAVAGFFSYVRNKKSLSLSHK